MACRVRSSLQCLKAYIYAVWPRSGFPAFSEAGVPNFEARSWFGIAAPAGTPRPIIDRIAADVLRVVQTPDYRKRVVLDLGLDPFEMGPDQFAAFLVKDRAKYEQRIKNANVKLD